MNEDIFTQRILVSILQVAMVPLCRLNSWARFTPDGFAVRDTWEKITFHEAAHYLIGSYVFTYIIIACAVLTIALVWTKLCYCAFVPAAVQLIILLIVYVYFMILKNRSTGFPDLVGIIHMGVAVACILVALLILRAHLQQKRSA